jgi:alkylhydroperoxidase family enzyme
VSERERAMLAFSVDLTEDATRISPVTLDGLRQHGFDDTAILQITVIASWFNYINRVADALGVGCGAGSGRG